MIEKLIEFSARNKFLVLILTAAAVGVGILTLKQIPLDAIPDLSDTQVIVYSRWDRSPDILEDQVTYPIVSALLGAPRVKDVRAFSDFGFSYVYVIFEDGTDVYWARSRVLEYLSKIQSKLPEGVKTELGPDATGIGWVYQYALVDRSGTHSLEQLRSYQDWNLRYAIQSVPGVAEVASIGGFQKQYQVQVDPNRLLSYGIPLSEVVEAVKKGNNEVGGRLVEFSGAEYMIRGRGYAKSTRDFEDIVIRSASGGAPVLVKDVAKVTLGPDLRRGISDLDGQGDTVGGIVVMRYHENALNVIRRVKERIRELEPSLPEGMEIVTVYDRSELIERAIETLKHQLVEEMLIVSAVILFFLWHIPSAIVPIVTIPVSVLLAFIPLYRLGITSNIMSLAGIAISIGVLVDGAIVEVENAYKKLELWQAGGRKGDFHEVRLSALKEVGPSVFFSLLVIAVAFMPIFTLVDQEGRLFKPLAYSKNLTMAIAAVLAVTLDPALRMLFALMDPFRFRPAWLARIADAVFVGRYYPEERHPVSRTLHRWYEPPARFVLRHPKAVLFAAFLAFLSCVPAYLRLGSEFMPPLNEGVVLYMPTTLPGISVTEAQKLMQEQDKILKSFPEVERVFGKAGRAETATDPAPLSMMETTVVLKPETEWRKVRRWYSGLPEALQAPLRHFCRDRISQEELIDEMDAKLQIPGVTNAWTMPIKNRVDMLSTGIRTPVGIKIFGDDLREIERTGLSIESALRGVRGTRSVFAERVTGGYFLDFRLKRASLARYGLSVDEANEAILTAIGGENVSTTVEGRERYSVSVRYAREFRDDLDGLKRTLVSTPSGTQIPLELVADLEIVQGPAMIRDENGRLSGYVYVDIAGRDVGGYVREAKAAVARSVAVPKGTYLVWSGQFENMIRVKKRLLFVVPATLALITLLLYLNTKSWVKTGIVLLAVPFSLIGAVWFLYALGYNVSIATWVGMIALMGLDAETGVFMLLYLDLSYGEAVRAGRMRNGRDLDEAVIHGAVKRIRPKLMTVMAAMLGLLPIMWSMGTGADVMKRIAAPMIGGLCTSFLMELLVYPPVYRLWRGRALRRTLPSAAPVP
ncbi:MAG TPA: CusA/CzcA family heavy metal efflux RND transporter [Candidatus Eisenbacteria bacterium]|nr:CusA/CzcA family heavy metal efflux RND transporter [Candidatus Eisenbacteria bacterium]